MFRAAAGEIPLVPRGGGEDVQPKAQNLVLGVRNGWVDDGAHAAAGLRGYGLEIHESGCPKS